MVLSLCGLDEDGGILGALIDCLLVYMGLKGSSWQQGMGLCPVMK
jgi:hypothetical protein